VRANYNYRTDPPDFTESRGEVLEFLRVRAQTWLTGGMFLDIQLRARLKRGTSILQSVYRVEFILIKRKPDTRIAITLSEPPPLTVHGLT
jgi:hypothetical protein